MNKPYWSGTKRAPKIIKFDSNDALHVELVQATANIFANILCLKE